MADDTSVEISFSASTDDVLAGIADVQEALAALTGSMSGVKANVAQLNASFTAAMPVSQISQCVKALSSMGGAARDARSGVGLLNTELGVQKTLLDAEVSQFKITQDQKFALLEAETANEYKAELDLLNNKRNAQTQGIQQYQSMTDQINRIAVNGYAALVRLDEQSIAAQQALWTGYLSTVTGAFNSQLRGLLEGTTSWHTATIKMLEDLTIKFIEMAEQMVVKWLAAEIAQTTATTTGAAARAAADQGASSAGVLANAANAVRTIMVDAGQAFAGVFVDVPVNHGPGVQGFKSERQPMIPTEPTFPDSIFHIPWFAYISAPLAAGIKPPPEIATERTADGGLLMTATEERLDPGLPEHARRARILAETLIARTGHAS